jgi:hypothetical protein
MTKKKKYISKALLNEKEIWKEFDRLSIKSKKKNKKDKSQVEINNKRIETKQSSNTEKFENSRIIKFLESSFSQRKSKTFISQFIFESKITSQNKKIETSSIESFFSLIVNTSKLSKEREIEKSFENSSITKKGTSMTQNVTLIETIESISSIQVEAKTSAKKTKMKDSSIKSFWNKRNDRKNLNEYLKNIKFIYQIDYKTQKAIKKNKNKYRDNVHRILFRQNFKKNVENWYFDLNKIVKSDWETLRAFFKTQFEVKTDAKIDKYLLLQRIITLI